MCARIARDAIESAPWETQPIHSADEWDTYAYQDGPSNGEIREAFEEEPESVCCRFCGDNGCIRCMGWD